VRCGYHLLGRPVYSSGSFRGGCWRSTRRRRGPLRNRTLAVANPCERRFTSLLVCLRLWPYADPVQLRGLSLKSGADYFDKSAAPPNFCAVFCGACLRTGSLFHATPRKRLEAVNFARSRRLVKVVLTHGAQVPYPRPTPATVISSHGVPAQLLPLTKQSVYGFWSFTPTLQSRADCGGVVSLGIRIGMRIPFVPSTKQHFSPNVYPQHTSYRTTEGSEPPTHTLKEPPAELACALGTTAPDAVADGGHSGGFRVLASEGMNFSSAPFVHDAYHGSRVTVASASTLASVTGGLPASTSTIAASLSVICSSLGAAASFRCTRAVLRTNRRRRSDSRDRAL
jgi:hypothetical protein